MHIYWLYECTKATNNAQTPSQPLLILLKLVYPEITNNIAPNLAASPPIETIAFEAYVERTIQKNNERQKQHPNCNSTSVSNG